MNGMKRTRLLLSAITTRVGSGSSAPRPANSAAKVGMTFHKITPMTTQAIDDDGDRIDHRRLDLALQLDGLFDVDREALQNGVENTARLAGRDHVAEQRVEHFRVALHRLGQRHAAFDVGAGLQNDLREVLVLLLVAENVEALHERQAGVDHDRELPREDGEVLRRHALGLELARLRDRAGFACAGWMRVT